jgi:Peptidase family M50
LPTITKSTKDFWASKKDSTGQLMTYAVSGMCLVWIMQSGAWFAGRIGLPEPRLGSEVWLFFFAILLANTAVHELGHATVAWALGHRVRAVSVGPFIFSCGPTGHKFQIRLARILDHSGYVRSVPGSIQNIRRDQIAIVAAGPTVSLMGGLLSLLILLSLPGTQRQSSWEVVALCSVVGLGGKIIRVNGVFPSK